MDVFDLMVLQLYGWEGSDRHNDLLDEVLHPDELLGHEDIEGVINVWGIFYS